ncbi:Putative transposase protein [Haloplasma contractile SSD-17B]|uniref:Transposase protein n=1 Tax=Haloplasma contractile SSD-17B TaxID=1033810 RepID=U2E7Q8_9MOLU|nr:Putative transposase protein [Haloplasma contractile SSD-17B]
MATYDKELKNSILQRMMPPKSESVALISRESGIPEQTLYKWKRKAKENGMPVTKGNSNSEKWSTQDKFSIVLETATLSEVELSEYCRNRGLYVEQIKAWKDACLQANGGVAKQATNLQKDLRNKEKEIKQLNKELQRKESALAETAALLVLRKKANAIWGENEED